jgi:protein SCO1/2
MSGGMKRPLVLLLLALMTIAAATGCTRPHGAITAISGAMPPLAFSLTRANDGVSVTEADYRGRIVILYFGYTNCPDACPATLANLATVLQALGPAASQVRVLFVSVDPARDSLAALKSYVGAFAPQIDGLRGSADEIAELARRYRVTYEVTPASPGHPYTVMHSTSVFIFDSRGGPRYVATSVGNTTAVEANIRALLQ